MHYIYIIFLTTFYICDCVVAYVLFSLAGTALGFENLLYLMSTFLPSVFRLYLSKPATVIDDFFSIFPFEFKLMNVFFEFEL